MVKGAARLTSRALRRVALTLDRIGDAQTAAMRRPGVDLAADPDELYYAEQYMHWLSPLLREQRTVVDVGCGAGRLTGPVARALPEARIVGVDLSPGKLVYARAHLVDCRNVELVEADCIAYLASLPEGFADLVLFTEVDFFSRQDQMLDAIARVTQDGGTLFGSFRSEWSNLAHSVHLRDFKSAESVRDGSAGELWNTPYRFRWYTRERLVTELARVGFIVDACYGIGVLSGREGDPLATLTRPADLAERARAECSLARALSGRTVRGLRTVHPRRRAPPVACLIDRRVICGNTQAASTVRLSARGGASSLLRPRKTSSSSSIVGRVSCSGSRHASMTRPSKAGRRRYVFTEGARRLDWG